MTTEAVALATHVISQLRTSLEKVVRGRRDTIDLVLTGLLADGHVLIEDYPGSGKTTLAKALGKLIGADASSQASHILPFRRIQFTPDMLPGDVLGVTVFEPQRGTFTFHHGPVFAHIVLADELNRTGPKVQAAFLECMAEKQVTIDNVTYPLDELFFVLGTQNPLDVAGTYPLPLVQLDRFMIRIPMGYVDQATEVEILAEHHRMTATAVELRPVTTRSELISARRAVSEVQIAPALREAIVNIVQETRRSPLLQFGASTRAALMFQQAVRAYALVQGRGYATEDDLVAMAPVVLLHRLRFHGTPAEQGAALTELMTPHLETLARKTS